MKKTRHQSKTLFKQKRKFDHLAPVVRNLPAHPAPGSIIKFKGPTKAGSSYKVAFDGSYRRTK